MIERVAIFGFISLNAVIMGWPNTGMLSTLPICRFYWCDGALSIASGSLPVCCHMIELCCLVQTFFKNTLASHFPPHSFDSVLASKRQMTFFLSYVARVATFLSKYDQFTDNQKMLHMGSVYFEQVCVND